MKLTSTFKNYKGIYFFLKITVFSYSKVIHNLRKQLSGMLYFYFDECNHTHTHFNTIATQYLYN